jgi:hypothetical protein
MATSGTPNAWDDPLFRQREFDAGVQSSGAWIIRALDLTTAADRINWVNAPVRDEEPSLGLFRVFRMLNGMSIETLLKGILVAQGESILDKNGKLNPTFSVHKLPELASKIDPTQFSFSADDLRILRETEPYVVWAGKYPFPKSEKEVMSISHSSMDMEKEIDLWNRLYEHLANIGWIMKGGKRLDLGPKI